MMSSGNNFRRRGNGGTRTKNNNNVQRQVMAKIRQLELNHAPRWIKTKSLNTDPTSYNATCPIARKLRFVGVTSTTASIDITAAEINSILLGMVNFSIDRIKAYGPAGTNMLQISTNINLPSAAQQVFNDIGTTGASRPCIDIKFPRTGLGIDVGSASDFVFNLDLLNGGSLARVAGEFIVDLWVTADWNAPVKVLA